MIVSVRVRVIGMVAVRMVIRLYKLEGSDGVH